MYKLSFNQQGKGGHCTCTPETPPGVLGATELDAEQEGHGSIRTTPEEGR